MPLWSGRINKNWTTITSKEKTRRPNALSLDKTRNLLKSANNWSDAWTTKWNTKAQSSANTAASLRGVGQNLTEKRCMKPAHKSNTLAVCSRMLHKEIRAVKLVFLQRVKEVTTDRADAARQPTDIQYWFITFFTAKEAQLNGCSCQVVNSTSISRIKSSYLTGSGLTERQLVSVR